jgi:diguanylate cyclase (GGDEF)-like protein
MSWGEGELYELLSLMMMGVCVWLAGTRLSVFDWLSRYAIDHDLMNLVLLSGCMGMGIFVAAVRKSFVLRRAILARLAAEGQAEAVARHDALTGLANRRLFYETFQASLKTRGGAGFAVLLIDLDRFKPVNDIHGHAAGNAVLCAVADRLREIVPPKSIVARLGGDEFAALVPHEGGRDALIRLAQQVIAAVRSPVPWGRGHVDVGATIGISLATPADHDAEALLHEADVAMYQGKREGRGTFRFFEAEMDVALKARAQLEADIRQAITRGEIIPFYQPIVRLPQQNLIGFEVLARWQHPDLGLISPDRFIPVAEETGMISDLCYGLLHQACCDARHWPPHLQLAVNIAPQQLQDRQLPERILTILTETGFAPERLEVEITESALINDLEAARSSLKALQDLGVVIALDDFGTGYSSLYHLRELRFNKLKIDRSYVSSLALGSERAKLVDAIIQLGTSLSLQTTAEGIETASSLDWLSEQGCNFGQGYLFGAPLPKEATDAFLAAETQKVAALLGAADWPKGGESREAADRAKAVASPGAPDASKLGAIPRAA